MAEEKLTIEEQMKPPKEGKGGESVAPVAEPQAAAQPPEPQAAAQPTEVQAQAQPAQPQTDTAQPQTEATVQAPAKPGAEKKKGFLSGIVAWLFPPKKVAGEVPAAPGTPAAPGAPAAPGTPATPGAPAKPGVPAKPGKTPKPEEAVKPGKQPEGALSPDEKKKLMEAEKVYLEGLTYIKDLIAPSSMEVQYDKIVIDGMFVKSFLVITYPRYIDANWLSPIINFDVTMDISQFIYPMDSAKILKILRTKVAQMQSAIRMNEEKGMVRDPALETALQDAEDLRTKLQRGQERFFQFGLYFQIYSENEDSLKKATKQLESLLGGKLIMTKKAEIQSEAAFNACLPFALDELEVNWNMSTSPLSASFPFSSVELTSNEGVLYGLNRHNDSLIIFDRFNLENANSVIFAKSGAGKSYGVKLEILRSLMIDTDVIVIDPENEYQTLTETVGGTYMKVSLTSDKRINPFDLPSPLEGEELKPGDLLRSSIIDITGLLRLMFKELSPAEEGIIDKALIDVYALKGITMDVVDPTGIEPPTMGDLYEVLKGMEGAGNLVKKLERFTSGTYSGIFNKPTNVELKTGLVVFSIRDLEDELRPIAMYIILRYIWNRVRSKLKKRILVIDEAWSMMQYEDSAKFLFGLVKRARKYYLGISTITQDVEDFLKSEFGKPIITNSSMQLLLKQSPTAIEDLGKIFNLTDGEKYLLLNSGVGQGLFFAGQKHVAIQIIASYTEDKIVTTKPEEVLAKKKEIIEQNMSEANVPKAESSDIVEESTEDVKVEEQQKPEPAPEETPAPEIPPAEPEPPKEEPPKDAPDLGEPQS